MLLWILCDGTVCTFLECLHPALVNLVARQDVLLTVQINIKSRKNVFAPSQINGINRERNGGRKFEKVGPNHPPRKKVAVIAHILNIFIYSARKNIANLKPEYSV